MNFVFFLCFCLIIKLLFGIYKDWEFIRNNNRLHTSIIDYTLTPEYETFLSELESILNIRSIQIQDTE